ncbi:hypothetical protein ACJJIU_10360 [Microbulbifer sp. CnH-101-E]|uniref:hypothetical protein n=1 Tax=unclassified Microbulbifer TaxID=2619833 RepID=UPI0040396D29
MNPVILDLLLVAVSALFSWLITHSYYKISMKNQEAEQSRERDMLKQALEKQNSNDDILIKQNYIDEAVKAWKSKGQAIHYLDSLTSVTKEEKSEILVAAALRHKGREPKNNPYSNENT